MKEVGLLPVISMFRRIKITMYYSDHNPPHFHVEYAGFKCLVDVLSGCVIYIDNWATCDQLSPKVFKKHKDELMQNWELAKEAQPLNKIEPL